MRWKHFLGSSAYFYKLIWLGCISVCIPVILVGTVYYHLSLDRMEKHILAEGELSLMMMQDRAETVLQSMEMESLQLSRDPILQQLLTNSPHLDVIHSKELLDKIALIKNTNEFIHEIFMYNSTSGTVLSNEYGAISKDEYKYEANIDQMLQSSYSTRWWQFSGDGKEGYVLFSRLLPVTGTGGAKGLLAFEIKVDALSQFLQTDTVILTDDQQLIIVNFQNPFVLERLPYEQLLERAIALPGLDFIKASDKNTGHFTAEDGDVKKAQYTYLKNVFSRTYVTVTPEQVITSQLNWVRGTTILILFLFVGVGIVLTYFTSKRAYTPIEQLIKHSRSLNSTSVTGQASDLDIIKQSLDYLSKESKKLEEYMEKAVPSLRERFLFQLLNGEFVKDEALVQDCQQYGIETEFTNVVLIIEVENIVNDKRYLPEDRGIIAFSLVNVMQEVLHHHPALKGYALILQGKGTALLQFNPDTEADLMLQATIDYASDVIRAVQQYLSFEVTVGIGRFYADVIDVPISYKEAEAALRYRIFRDSESILFIDDVEHVKKKMNLQYPRELENTVLDALRQGDVTTAVEHFKRFSERLRNSQSYVFIYQSYHVFLSAMIVSLEKQGVNEGDLVDYHLFGQLRSKQTAKEISDWFEETLFPLYVWLTRKDREAAGETAIQQICNYIKSNLGSDLSLVHCADVVGMSPSYVSKLFKEEMGMNFLEYVVEVKIDEAKRLLKETDDSISEIATAIGYSERNLNRIFQRDIKMSPGNFRALHR